MPPQRSMKDIQKNINEDAMIRQQHNEHNKDLKQKKFYANVDVYIISID